MGTGEPSSTASACDQANVPVEEGTQPQELTQADANRRVQELEKQIQAMQQHFNTELQDAERRYQEQLHELTNRHRISLEQLQKTHEDRVHELEVLVSSLEADPLNRII